MAPSSGGTCPFDESTRKDLRRMNEKLQASLGVSLLVPPGKVARFRIKGDLGPLFLPAVCNEGQLQSVREEAEGYCNAILAKQHELKVFHAECRRLWLLCAHSLKSPVSSFWMERCSFGVPEGVPDEWSHAFKIYQNSEKMQEVDHSAVLQSEAMQAGNELETTDSQTCAQNHSLSFSLCHFGRPQDPCQIANRLNESECMHQTMPSALSPLLRNFGLPCITGKPDVPLQQQEAYLADTLEQSGPPAATSGANLQRVDIADCQACRENTGTPFLYSVLTSLQSCFAFLQGTRVGEASHPGPLSTKVNAAQQVRHDPSVGVRIGEAKNPGPSPFGPELENMIKQYVMEAVREAIKEAFQNLGLSAPVTSPSMQTTSADQGGQHAANTSPGKPEKGSQKGKAKPPKPPPNDKDRGKGKDTPVAKPGQTTDQPSDPHVPSPPNKRGKGKGQTADNEWKLVNRQPKSGDFQLRAQDWNAPVIPFNKLSAAIDANPANGVLEGVILAEKREVENAKLMLHGSKIQFKFLLIYLAKEEKSQKIPGRIQDHLCFRDAIVLQCHSSTIADSPTPAGLASTPIKVAPLQSVAVYVRVPKQYASEQTWANFRKNASKTAATWAADRHVQPLDSFNWAEEKQKTGGQELQVFGIMRIPSKDMSTLLAVSGQQGVFIEPCRSQAPRIKISWIERIKSETNLQYLSRANQHGAAFGVAVHGGRLGWRLAAQPDELLPRVWTLPWLPLHWDDNAVKQLLTSEFKDIDLLTHRRNRGQLSYRFRATCLKGDKDLVALLAETDSGPITLWASVAPARTLQKAQRKLPQGAVPVIPPKQRSTAFPTTTKAVTEPEIGEDGKPVPGAKRTKCDVRTVPNELKTVEVAKDGNCIYHAISEGLAWLSGGKIKVEHRELRAKAITHLQKHKSAYSAQWDGESPAGAPMQSFDDYLAASAKDSSYGSPLEVEALARVYDVQIILIPSLADFAVMSFRTSQAKRVLVLWYQDKHVDLLIPKEDIKKYPEAVLSITTGPVHKLRAGGPRSHSRHVSKTKSGGPRSTSSRASKTESVWTIGARSSASLLSQSNGNRGKGATDDRSLETSSMWSGPRAPSDVSITQGVAKARSTCCASACKTRSHKSDATLAKPNVRSVSAGSTKAKIQDPQKQGGSVCSSRSNRVGEALPSSLPRNSCLDPSSCTKKRKAVDVESDAESQDLSGCQAGRPCKQHKPAERSPAKTEHASFMTICPYCPFKVSWPTQAQSRGCLRHHCKKHHPAKPLPKPMPRRKTGKRASYENLVRVFDEGESLYWQCSLCRMAIHQDDADKFSESSLAKHKAQHKRKHHPRLSWKKWRALDYEDRACKGVRTKLFARTSNFFEEIKEMQQQGIRFLWWPRRRGHCKHLKRQSNFIARMRPAWVCERCGTTTLEKQNAIKHAKFGCPHKNKSSTFSLAKSKNLLKHRISTLTKLRQDYCKLAPSSKRRTAELLLFDKALECFRGFLF